MNNTNSKNPRFLQVSTNKDLVRDTFNNGIVNTNKAAAEASKKRYYRALESAAIEKRHSSELNTMRMEIKELKELLHKILLEKK